MVVDGITCTGVTTFIQTMYPPDGHVWNLGLHGTCDTLGNVDANVNGRDNAPYPPSCDGRTFMRVSMGAEGDAGTLAYDASDSLGSCTVSSGPSLSNLLTPISFDATVEGMSGGTHTLSFH